MFLEPSLVRMLISYLMMPMIPIKLSALRGFPTNLLITDSFDRYKYTTRLK